MLRLPALSLVLEPNLDHPRGHVELLGEVEALLGRGEERLFKDFIESGDLVRGGSPSLRLGGLGDCLGDGWVCSSSGGGVVVGARGWCQMGVWGGHMVVRGMRGHHMVGSMVRERRRGNMVMCVMGSRMVNWHWCGRCVDGCMNGSGVGRCRHDGRRG